MNKTKCKTCVFIPPCQLCNSNNFHTHKDIIKPSPVTRTKRRKQVHSGNVGNYKDRTKDIYNYVKYANI